jgi:hypothetical protein
MEVVKPSMSAAAKTGLDERSRRADNPRRQPEAPHKK